MTEIGLFSTNLSNTAPSIGGLLQDKIEESPSYTISSHLYTTAPCPNVRRVQSHMAVSRASASKPETSAPSKITLKASRATAAQTSSRYSFNETLSPLAFSTEA